ncbi:hypothetical protein G6F60_013747 [Rhizopus arrhizus]|nr:hypothetical protein G6F60_013747 [Rhizopus arrhizus]
MIELLEQRAVRTGSEAQLQAEEGGGQRQQHHIAGQQPVMPARAPLQPTAAVQPAPAEDAQRQAQQRAEHTAAEQIEHAQARPEFVQPPTIVEPSPCSAAPPSVGAERWSARAGQQCDNRAPFLQQRGPHGQTDPGQRGCAAYPLRR